MGQPVSRSMCCSVREKDGRGRLGFVTNESPQFLCNEVELGLEHPCFVAFAPLWNTGSAGSTRRLAVASASAVHVYRLSDSALQGAEIPPMVLEHTLTMPADLTINAVLFRDEDTSRCLVVAYGPTTSSHEGKAGQHFIRVWSCDGPASGSRMVKQVSTGSSVSLATFAAPHENFVSADAPAEHEVSDESALPYAWHLNEGFVASLEDHTARVTRLVVSSTYLLSADDQGECRVWQKNRGFASRAAARLHQGAVVDLAVDRLYAYSLGQQDLCVRVWSVPDLKPVLTILADSVEGGPANFSGFAVATPMAPGAGRHSTACRLAQLSTVRRPVSRWSGAQGSTRSAGAPRGMLFVSGVLAEGQETAGAGAAVLMEWSLGTNPRCQSAQIAHDTPIETMAYGPYDNGPLITADKSGTFRVWDYTPRLWCSQQVEAGAPIFGGGLAIAVDPLHRTVFSVTGTRRLLCWTPRGALDAPIEQG